MNLTREDMLRELELLPVWQSHSPAAVYANKHAENTQVVDNQTPESAVSGASASPDLRIILSEDAQYLFVLSATKNAQEETLLQNMLKSIAAKPRVDIASAGIAQIPEYQAKLMVTMGEIAAQSVLSTTEPLEALRGRLHQHATMPVVATYHPADLLRNLSDKPRAWQDLCFARASMQGLSSESL